jgi:probable phosphoglycerate mutase
VSEDEHPDGIRQVRFRPAESATTLLIVRHGESAAVLPGQPGPMRDGHGDPALHVDGEVQAQRLGARLAAEHRAGATIDAIYVTTLQRTHQTAAPLAEALGITPIVEPELREVFLGDWEASGTFRARVLAGDPIIQRVFEEERWDEIPGAERLEAFDQRISAAIERIVAAHPGQRVVVVAHGAVIGHLMHQATGSRRFAFAATDNASISELVVHDGRTTMRRYNDTAHLR